MAMSMIEKTHYVSVTVIVGKGDRFLICKRSEQEELFPGKWCVPGGKVEQSAFASRPHDVARYWLDVFEKVAAAEVMEETGLSVRDIGYVSNLALLRPNGYATIIVSMHASWAGGEVVLQQDELVDHAWVTLEEAKRYDLLENLWEQMRRVDQLRS